HARLGAGRCKRSAAGIHLRAHAAGRSCGREPGGAGHVAVARTNRTLRPFRSLEMAADESDFDPESLTLDANAVAGMLQAIFGSDMTAAMSECGHCGNHAMVGTM